MSNVKKIIVTGGSGFIGSAVIRHLLAHNDCQVMNLDKMTYAANPMTTQAFEKNERYSFLQADICDTALMAKVLNDYQPDGIMHLAAESHVDRSIDFSEDFIRTNILGTHVLLEAARAYYAKQTCERQAQFRFHHISTDEVFGSLSETDDMFTESTKYAPNSPYSASKAASDHLVRAWNKTYGLPVVMSNCSNNYGPYQFPEKLIPFMIQRALAGESLSVYGDGQNIRDWLYVDDHASALVKIFEQGQLGESYNVGGINEIRNIDVVHHICDILDQLKPAAKSYKEQVVFVKDRPGHDFRYAIDTSKIANELNWSPIETFETGIQKTIEWYLNNDAWCQLASEQYQGQRLGVSE